MNAKKSPNKRLLSALVAHEKRLRQLGVSEDVLRGRRNRPSVNDFPNLRSGERNIAPTSDRICGPGFSRQEQRYTGTEIMGIGTMHKSNSVPVLRGTSDAEDIARMRRG